MKTINIMLIIGFMLLFAPFSYAQKMVDIKGGESVTGKLDGVDVAEPAQTKAETKWLINTLNTYNMFRQIAGSILADVNAVLNVAYSVQDQLNSIEKFFLQIEDIAKNCSTVTANVERLKDSVDWRNPVRSVFFVEEQIMQPMDNVVLGSMVGLPNAFRGVTNSSKAVGRSVVNVGKVMVAQGKAVDSSARTISWFSWMMAEVKDSASRVRRDSIERNQQRTLGDSGFTNPYLFAEQNRNTRRMEYYQSLAEHEYVGQNIALWSEILLKETEELSTTNNQRYGMYKSVRGAF